MENGAMNVVSRGQTTFPFFFVVQKHNYNECCEELFENSKWSISINESTASILNI